MRLSFQVLEFFDAIRFIYGTVLLSFVGNLQLRRSRWPLQRLSLVLEVLDQLPYTKIHHYVFRTSGYPDTWDFAVDSWYHVRTDLKLFGGRSLTLNQLALPALCVSVASK
jgi:hypothetical protein